MDKYIKCFSEEKHNELIESGFTFLYEQNQVYWFEDNEKLTANFSENHGLKDIKFTSTINF